MQTDLSPPAVAQFLPSSMVLTAKFISRVSVSWDWDVGADAKQDITDSAPGM
jgi:hypothetical protein